MAASADTIRVLHVDDDPEFADLTATFLEREHDRVVVDTAADADDGLDRLAGGDIDCIVSDYDMPGRDGIAFLKAVREIHPDLPFVLYTGKGSEEVAAEAISAGVTDYLQKGSGTDQYALLANRVVNAVERYRIEREAGETRTQLEAIAQNSADAIVIIDAESCVRFANPAVEALFGYAPAELEGESLTTLIPERHRGAHLEAVRRYTETGEPEMDWSSVEFPGQHRDGTEVPLSVSFSEFEQDGETRFLGVMRDISERTRIEEELRERETQFRQLAENIQEVVWMSDPEKEEMIYVNPAYEEIWGRSVESLYEDPTGFLDAVHPEDSERVEAALDTQADGEYDEEYRIVRPDGERRWVHDRAIPVRDDAGEVYRIVGVASDITAQKERERRLRSERQFVQSLYDSLPDPLYAVDTDGSPIRWNETLEAVTGYTGEEIEEMRFTELLPEEDVDAVSGSFETVLEERRSVTVEASFETKAGERIPFEFTGSPLESADGSLRGVTGVGREVTERKRVERHLEAERRRVERLFDTSPVGITILDTEGEIVRANRRAEEVLGLDDAAITGRQYDAPEWEIVDEEGDAVPSDELPFARVVATGDPVFDYEHGISYPDGSRQWLSVNAAPLTTDDGDIEEVVAAIANVTHQHEHEQSIEAQNERLEEFTSIVSHDLRNPLNVAQGRLELLEEEYDTEHVDAIRRAHQRMDTLIADLLTLAREGDSATDITTVALDELVAACWRNVETTDASLTVEVERTVRADEGRLRQLFENLIRNAVDHAGPEVSVTVGELEEGFYVADDGPGVDPADREDIFEAGYSTAEKGTGFGLSIVTQIAEAHGWTVEVTKSVDGGARFEVTGVERGE